MTGQLFRSRFDADDADAVEQSLPVDPADTESVELGIDTVPFEAYEADVAEQAIPVAPEDPDDYRHATDNSVEKHSQ